MGWLLAIAVFGLIYPYVLYPLTLAAVSRALAHPPMPPADLPMVAILVSAFNEEDRILDKLANFAALDYPPDLVEMWIGTDGSTDRTAQLIRDSAMTRVHVIERPVRSGKTTVLNDLAGRTRASVLVFTDVNAAFRPDALGRLVAPLADPKTGLVSGRTMIRGQEGNVAVEGAYYRLESFLKAHEGACGWLAGADGAIYALRASLYSSLPPEYINDLVHPSQVVAQGYRAQFESSAISEEAAGDDAGREFDRQTRIAAQASYLLAVQWWPLFRNGRLGMLWVLLSHKWLRWIAGIWIPLGWVGLSGVSSGLGVASLLLAGVIVTGWRSGTAWANLPVFFLVVHTAYLKGLWQALIGERYVVWKPRGG